MRASHDLVHKLNAARPVSLPNLQILYISDDGQQGLRLSRLELLRYLDIPACIPLKFKAWLGKEQFLSWLSRPQLAYPPRDVMAIHDTADFNEVPLLQITLTAGEPWFEWSVAPQDSVRLSAWLDSTEVPDVLEAMGNSAASSVRVLAFLHNDDACDDACADGTICADLARIAVSLRRFTSVSELQLLRQGDKQIEIISLLCAPAPDVDWIFPVLRTLVLELGRNQSKVFWVQLRAMLASRRAEGRPLERLIVRGEGACHPEDFLGSEDWDGRDDESDNVEIKGRMAARLKESEITLAEERQLVTKVVDEREPSCCCFDYICDY